jgi:hypothetical protein
MNLGLLIILITALGYLSNQLNGRWLNFKIVRWLYYLGAVVHELSHALACLLVGARITELKIFDHQPRVTHTRPKLPLIGQIIISLAPLAGGLIFFYLLNKYALNNYFFIPTLTGLSDVKTAAGQLLQQINLLNWQSWVMILLSLNSGAMIGPSAQDLKNIWPALIIMLFISWPQFTSFGLLIISLIVINIILQLVIVFIKKFLTAIIPKQKHLR